MNIGKPLFAVIILLTTSSVFGQTVRWYSAEQVAQGQQVFKRKCAKCHGINAQGEADWRKPDEDGEYPPPPLNGNAYAWHHSLEQLRQQIQVGSDMQEGDMPAFKNKLTAEEIDTVIAFFQSKWSDITYIVWQSKQYPSSTRENITSKEPGQHNNTHWLKQHLSAARIIPGEPMKTPVKGILEVRVGDEFVYLSEDGDYAFTGHLINLRNGSNLTVLNQAMETKRLLQTYSEQNMLVYSANGIEKTHLTIFTDTSCAYCRKMHKEVPRLQSEGVTVRFIPYPRRGLGGKGYAELKSIWCSEDPGLALSTYIEDRVLPNIMKNCNKIGAVDAGFQLGNSMGISGTPLLVLENGQRINGYKPAADVLGRMNIPSDTL